MGYTGLRAAAARGDAGQVRELAARGGKADGRDAHGRYDVVMIPGVGDDVPRYGTFNATESTKERARWSCTTRCARPSPPANSRPIRCPTPRWGRFSIRRASRRAAATARAG